MSSKILLPEDIVKFEEEYQQGSEPEVKHRPLSNTVIRVRDGGAEYMLRVRERLALVVTNQIDEKEQMEGICGEALIAIDELIMLNLTIGAQIRPDTVVDQKIESLRKAMPNFILVRAVQ